jgi:membrane-bound ClpP family serine protease
MEDEHEDHGHSTAAWTGVGIILVGSVVVAIAVLLPSLLLGIIGTAIIIAGAGAGKVLSMAGYGSNGHHAQAGSVIDAPDESGADTLGKS